VQVFVFEHLAVVGIGFCLDAVLANSYLRKLSTLSSTSQRAVTLISGILMMDCRSAQPMPLTPITPTFSLSLAEIIFFACANVSQGNAAARTAPAAALAEAFKNFLREYVISFELLKVKRSNSIEI
jgi:hypothetical protein